MDMLYLNLLKLIYENKDQTVKEKVDETCRCFPQLNLFYRDDLEMIYTKPLPIIEGLKVSTRKVGDDSCYDYVEIVSIQDPICTDVQKAIMRIGGCLGGFTVEKWGIGSPNSQPMKEHLDEYKKQYFNEHDRPIGYVAGEEAGYPKVITVWQEELAGCPNESWAIDKLIGLVVG